MKEQSLYKVYVHLIDEHLEREYFFHDMEKAVTRAQDFIEGVLEDNGFYDLSDEQKDDKINHDHDFDLDINEGYLRWYDICTITVYMVPFEDAPVTETLYVAVIHEYIYSQALTLKTPHLSSTCRSSLLAMLKGYYISHVGNWDDFEKWIEDEHDFESLPESLGRVIILEYDIKV